MEGDTGLILDATRKTSRLLQRDLFELESLQASDKATEPFCQQPCRKALQTLHIMNLAGSRRVNAFLAPSTFRTYVASDRDSVTFSVHVCK